MTQTKTALTRGAASALCLAALLALGTAARADKAAGDACAASLNASGKAIYAATLPGLSASTDLRAAVTASTRSLVQAGKVSMGDARPAAEAAGQCLQLARS
ncbi:hypothetical protein [Ancylobacter terrae]|uniref:hypothetical protein n=1 Tax=Ancylobacter sp. sgz301288 TaxID=3342077 RepID=UPI00385FD5AF